VRNPQCCVCCVWCVVLCNEAGCGCCTVTNIILGSEPSEDEFMSDDLDEWALERQTGIKNSWFCYCLRAHKSKKENCSQYYKRKSGVTICDEAMIDDEYVYRKSRKRKLELAMAKILKNVPEGEERRMVPRIQLRIDEMNIRDDRVQEAIESLVGN